MIEFTTEPGPSEDITIINEGSSGGITEMLAALTALVLIALASFPLMESPRWAADTGLSVGTVHSAPAAAATSAAGGRSGS